MKTKICLLTAILIAIGSILIAQTGIHQSFIVRDYSVEYAIISKDGGAYKPVYEKYIALNGRPMDTAKIERIVLTFSTDPVTASKKPEYDEMKHYAFAWYPMTEFDSYYEMLKHKKGSLKATFIHSATLQEKRVEFVTNGLIPLLR